MVKRPLQFTRIYQTEVLVDNGIKYEYRAYGSKDGRTCGAVKGASKEECQEAIDYALANEDEFVSGVMRNLGL